MTSFKEQLDQHNEQLNGSGSKQLLNRIGVPAIVFGVFMLLNWINIELAGTIKVSFAVLLLVAAAAYYFMISTPKLAAATAGVMLVLLLFAAWLAGGTPSGSSILLLLIVLGGGLGALISAHGVEKSKTTLLKKPLTVIKAPLFLVNDLLIALGVNKMIPKA